MLIFKPVLTGLILAILLAFTGCARKGPLFMPKTAEKPAAESGAAQSRTVPNPVIQSQPETSKQP